MIDSAIIRYSRLRRCMNALFSFFMIVLLIVFVISSMIGSWVGNDVTTESMKPYKYIKLIDVEKYSLYVYDAQFTVLNTTAFDSLGFLCRPQAETNETYSIKYSLLKMDSHLAFLVTLVASSAIWTFLKDWSSHPQRSCSTSNLMMV